MGLGAVEVDGDRYAVALSTALSPPRKAEIAERLAWLHERIDAIVGDLKPEVVAIESPFVSRNVKAAVAVGQAQAVAMIAAASHGVPVATYAPREGGRHLPHPVHADGRHRDVGVVHGLLTGYVSLRDSPADGRGLGGGRHGWA